MNGKTQALLLKILFILFAFNTLTLCIYFTAHYKTSSSSSPHRKPTSENRFPFPENRHSSKPWPILPSYLPWSHSSTVPLRSCEAYFGNGFNRRVDLLKPNLAGKLAGWFRCWYSETLASSICEGARVRMWPERISMSRGGERIEEVIGRKEETELPKFRDGAFELDGGDTVVGKERVLADEKFLNGFVPAGEIQSHTMRALFGSFRVVSGNDFECQEWIEEPVVLVTRFEYANLFHTITDWYSAYVSSRVVGLPNRPHLVFVDGHCKTPLEETWKALFSSLKYTKNFSAPVCFRHVIFSPLGYETALFKGLTEGINCHGGSSHELWLKPDVQKTARLSEFGEMVRAAFGFPVDRQVERPPSIHNVLFVRREDYLAHPRHGGRVESRLTNEQEIFDSLQNWASNHRECKVNLVNGLFAHMSMKEQLRAIQDASVIIGAHGAGLTHIIGASYLFTYKIGSNYSLVLPRKPFILRLPSSNCPAMAAGSELVSLLLLLSIANLCNGGITSRYTRKLEASVDMPAEAFPPPGGYNAPEQVHITQGDRDGRGVIISWVTPLSPKPNVVRYWAADCDEKHADECQARTTTYKYYNYTSGFIHHATIKNLKYGTKYFYELGSDNVTRRFFFTTPPMVGPDVPYTFGIIGDLGQTYDSNQTFEHYYSNSKGQAVLFVGDLSYADNHPFHDNRKWDTWGRFVEKSTAYQPWIWTAGNHEMDFAPEIGEKTPFKPFTRRYHVPYRSAQSTSPLWYSIKRASAYIIVLSSYSAYGTYTPQYEWLQKEFTKVNREETPWLIVMVHSPWYNSYEYHYMEGESMRVMFESWFVQNKVDLVLSGHVHAYERSERVSNVRYNITNRLSTPIRDSNAPIYLTVGDGGNIEGLANRYTEPQPSYSAYREASFGHAMLEIKNRTHAYYTWHRNQDAEPVAADSLWIYNRHWYPEDESSQ